MSFKESPSLHTAFCQFSSDPCCKGSNTMCAVRTFTIPHMAKESQVSWLWLHPTKPIFLQQALAKTVEYAAGSPKCARYLSTNKIRFLTLKLLICKWILYGRSPGDFKQIGNKKGTVTNTRFSNFFYTSRSSKGILPSINIYMSSLCNFLTVAKIVPKI